MADLQERLDRLTKGDSRIVVGEITVDDDGQPICGLAFNCDSYDPPINGVPDPRAVQDLSDALAAINPDHCVVTTAYELLDEESAERILEVARR